MPHIYFSTVKITEHLITRIRQKLFIKNMFKNLKFYFSNSNHYTKRRIIVLYIGISLVKFFHSGVSGCLWMGGAGKVIIFSVCLFKVIA